MNERRDPLMSEDVRSAAERLLIDQWRVQAWTSNEEGRRIHRTIHATTDAEERCYARAEIWIQCAEELSSLLASLVRGEGHEEQKKEEDARMDGSTQLVEQRATASTVTPSATNGTKEPGYFPFAIERKDPADTCGGCGGPYAWDTTIQSEVWNRVVRPLGISEYLCTNCILRLFAARGEDFSAELWGRPERR